VSVSDTVRTNSTTESPNHRYVADVAKSEAFNAIYVEMMPKPLPSRTFLGVAALPGGAQIEIEVTDARQ